MTATTEVVHERILSPSIFEITSDINLKVFLSLCFDLEGFEVDSNYSGVTIHERKN